jgi:hypothetical protein
VYDFHYNFVKKQWPSNRLLFIDTDSVVYEIECEDLYQDLYNNRHLFDLSDYPRDSKFHDDTNKNYIGKFKDEMNWHIIKYFIGLRSKMYAILLDNNKITKKAKDLPHDFVKKFMEFDDYKYALDGGVSFMGAIAIRTNYHKLETDVIIKRGLSNFDDKRYCENGVDTFALG